MNQDLQVVMETLISEMGKMEGRINKRLDQHDKRFEQIDKRFDQHDKRFEQIDRRFACMESDMKMYVNALVDEIGRLEARMNIRFQKIDDRLDSMQHEINGCKLTCDTVSLLIQRVDQHEDRIERLEKKNGIGKMLLAGE